MSGLLRRYKVTEILTIWVLRLLCFGAPQSPNLRLAPSSFGMARRTKLHTSPTRIVIFREGRLCISHDKVDDKMRNQSKFLCQLFFFLQQPIKSLPLNQCWWLKNGWKLGLRNLGWRSSFNQFLPYRIEDNDVSLSESWLLHWEKWAVYDRCQLGASIYW